MSARLDSETRKELTQAGLNVYERPQWTPASRKPIMPWQVDAYYTSVRTEDGYNFYLDSTFRFNPKTGIHERTWSDGDLTVTTSELLNWATA